MKTLLDHNLGNRHRIFLSSSLQQDGWLDLIDVPILTFAEVGLSINTSDREIWRYVQNQQLILLTANRNNDGADSLEHTIQDENFPTSLPVLTIGDADRIMIDNAYCKKCAERIADIFMNIENYLGVGRVYIP
jgi:predicted nuclease of predicted toxin-antitoxin system